MVNGQQGSDVVSWRILPKVKLNKIGVFDLQTSGHYSPWTFSLKPQSILVAVLTGGWVILVVVAPFCPI